ncbi:hypothetical protein [Planobispora rosea]|nr:hypothetical protein [Planobispora rosea]
MSTPSEYTPPTGAHEHELATHNALAWVRFLSGHAQIAEAELAAAGLHPVTIAHGDPEDPEETQALFKTLPRQAKQTQALQARSGGNDYTTYLFTNPTAAAAFTADAVALARPWWRITPTAHPLWR